MFKGNGGPERDEQQNKTLRGKIGKLILLLLSVEVHSAPGNAVSMVLHDHLLLSGHVLILATCQHRALLRYACMRSCCLSAKVITSTRFLQHP